MDVDSLFYPVLQRRLNYTTKADGTYYVYSKYKQEIREDCIGRCVYCDTHENEAGGMECMELDHFRPQKYDEHKHLVNDPNNLIWTCRGCNRFKSDHWPALGTSNTFLGDEGFIDAFVENRRDYYEVLPDGKIVAIKPPAQYVITYLALNRPTRKRLRELRYLKLSWIQEFEEQITKLSSLLEHSKSLDNDQRDCLSKHVKWLEEQVDRIKEVLLDFRLL